tara:strand:+ start:1005 stop:1373 length:369 start_codon:yes stop_codon:yes gene_type:complete
VKVRRANIEIGSQAREIDMQKTLRCFARGYDDRFEAICIDLDISVEARTLDEARRCLEAAIRSYVEAAVKEAPDVAVALLSRRSPMHVRAQWILSFAFHMLFASPSRNEKSMHAGYDLPCPA